MSQVGSGRLGSGRLGSARLGSGVFTISRVGPGRVRGFHNLAGRVGSDQLGRAHATTELTRLDPTREV